MDERKTDYKHLERERIISISDLFEEILRRIWLIIVLAVLFAVICAGYKYMSDKSKAENSTETASFEKTAASLTDEEMSEVNSVFELYNEVAGAEQYLNKSILMNIDPYHEDRVLMQFSLGVEDVNLASVMQTLSTYISGMPIAFDLQEYYPDVDCTYLAELISFESESPTLDMSGVGTMVYQSNIFNVYVIHLDADSCQQLADAVKQCIDDYLESISVYFGDCSITLIDEHASQVYDSTLRSIQTSAVSDQITLQNKITTQTDYLSNKQVEVLEAMLVGESMADVGSSTDIVLESTEANATAKVHISARYTLIGVVIGIVLAVIIIILYYIFRGTLNIPQEMQGEFGIPVFGHLHVKKQKNPLVRAWRRLVYKRKPLPLETEQKLAITNIKTYCKNHHVERILLAGTEQRLSEDQCVETILAALREDQIEAEITGGLPDSPEALDILTQYPCVALVETLHVSHYRNVVSEVELCMDQSIEIVGSIVLDQ